jgi:hypothetical protein
LINGRDRCIYSKFDNNKGVIICLYVDDLFIYGTSIDVVHDVKRFIVPNFNMKDMSPAGKAGVLPDLCGGGALHGSEVYLTRVGSRSGPALEGFLVIKKYERYE